MNKQAKLGATACLVLLLAPLTAAEPAQLPLQRLQTQARERVYFGATDGWIGSTPEQIVEAIADCARETLSQYCDPAFFGVEAPRHRVRLAAFWLDRYEVSVAHYLRCVAARRCEPVPYTLGAQRLAQADLPVTLVRHTDAEAYCRFVGGALPTEAQFERAARGLTGRTYPWGNVYHSKRANHGRLAFEGTSVEDDVAELAPVNAFPDGVTPEGVYNLAGNAEEWVLDRFAPYVATLEQDPSGPDETSGATERSIRGGGFRTARAWLRGASRSAAAPESRSDSRGFRCAYGKLGVRSS